MRNDGGKQKNADRGLSSRPRSSSCYSDLKRLLHKGLLRLFFLKGLGLIEELIVLHQFD